MKTYSVRVSVRAENEDDLHERLADLTENPIDNYIDQSIEEIEEEEICTCDSEEYCIGRHY